MAYLNIGKLVCEREGHRFEKTYKRDEATGRTIAKQCTKCGKIKWIGS